MDVSRDYCCGEGIGGRHGMAVTVVVGCRPFCRLLNCVREMKKDQKQAMIFTGKTIEQSEDGDV